MINKERIDELKHEFSEKLIEKGKKDLYSQFEIEKAISEIFKKILYKNKYYCYEFLIDMNKALDYRIKNDVYCQEIVASLIAIANITSKDLDKKVLDEYEIIEKEKKIQQEKHEKIVQNENKKISEDIVDYFSKIENNKRNELENLEQIENAQTKLEIKKINPDKGDIEIIGILNQAMYEMNRTHLIDCLKKGGVKVSKDSKFIEYMSDDLLRYRIAVLQMIKVYCMEEKNYNKLKLKVAKLGTIAKQTYENIYGITPLNEIKNNAYGVQIVIDGIFLR